MIKSPKKLNRRSRFVTSDSSDFFLIGKDGKPTHGLFAEGQSRELSRSYTLATTSATASDPEDVLDAVAGRARTLTRKARAALLAAVEAAPFGQALQAARRWADEWHGELAELLGETRLAAMLHGMDGVADRLEGEPLPLTEQGEIADDTALPLVKEAANRLASMQLLGMPEYLRAKDAATAAAQAEVEAMTGEAISKVRSALLQSIEDGGTLEDFRSELKDRFAEGVLTPGHVAENVFRTNVMAAYSDGQERLLSDPLVGSLFPYRAYHATHDDRTRPEHLGMEKAGIGGTNIYRADDPVWQMFRPPWSWQCRCTATPLSVAEAARRGIPEAQQWLATGAEPAQKSFVPMPPWKPDDEFLHRDVELSTDPDYPVADIEDWSEPTGYELAAPDASRYQQRKVTRGPRKGQTAWYDTAKNRIMPANWKPAGEKPAKAAKAAPAARAKGDSHNFKTTGHPAFDDAVASAKSPVERARAVYDHAGVIAKLEHAGHGDLKDKYLAWALDGLTDRDAAALAKGGVPLPAKPRAADVADVINARHRAVSRSGMGERGDRRKELALNDLARGGYDASKIGKQIDQPEEVAAKKPAAAPKLAKAAPATVDELHDAITQAASSGKPVSADDVRALAEKIATMKGDDIKALRQKVGMTKGSGTKAKMADELARKALGGEPAKPAKQPKVKATPKKAAAKPPTPDAPKPQPKAKKPSAPDASPDLDEFERGMSPPADPQKYGASQDVAARGDAIRRKVLAAGKVPDVDEDKAWAAVGKAWPKMEEEFRKTAALPTIPKLYELAKAEMPELTRARFYDLLEKWQKDDRLVMQVVNDPHFEPEAHLMPVGAPESSREGQVLGYIDMKQPAKPPTPDEPKPQPKQAQAKPSMSAGERLKSIHSGAVAKYGKDKPFEADLRKAVDEVFAGLSTEEAAEAVKAIGYLRKVKSKKDAAEQAYKMIHNSIGGYRRAFE